MDMCLPLTGLIFLCFAFSEAVPKYEESIILADGAYNVSWTYNNDTDRFYFKVRAKAVGWIGFGVTRLNFPPNPDNNWVKHGMDSYDVVVGGVFNTNDSIYHSDYFTDEYGFPKKDEKQDWKLNSGEQDDGFTTLEYERPRNTNDTDDNEIMSGYMFLVWAYHNSSDEFRSASNKHTASGLSPKLQLIRKVRDPPERITPRPPGETSGVSCMMIGHLFLAFLAVVFFY